MRHLTTITTLLFLLGFLGASNASGAAANVAILMASSTNKQVVSKDIKEDTSNRISCVPQGDPQHQLWKCQDAYGNQYEDLVIILQSEIDKLKSGKNKK